MARDMAGDLAGDDVGVMDGVHEIGGLLQQPMRASA